MSRRFQSFLSHLYLILYHECTSTGLCFCPASFSKRKANLCLSSGSAKQVCTVCILSGNLELLQGIGNAARHSHAGVLCAV